VNRAMRRAVKKAANKPEKKDERINKSVFLSSFSTVLNNIHGVGGAILSGEVDKLRLGAVRGHFKVAEVLASRKGIAIPASIESAQKTIAAIVAGLPVDEDRVIEIEQAVKDSNAIMLSCTPEEIHDAADTVHIQSYLNGDSEAGLYE
jgi:hypothetical protein